MHREPTSYNYRLAENVRCNSSSGIIYILCVSLECMLVIQTNSGNVLSDDDTHSPNLVLVACCRSRRERAEPSVSRFSEPTFCANQAPGTILTCKTDPKNNPRTGVLCVGIWLSPRQIILGFLRKNCKKLWSPTPPQSFTTDSPPATHLRKQQARTPCDPPRSREPRQHRLGARQRDIRTSFDNCSKKPARSSTDRNRKLCSNFPRRQQGKQAGPWVLRARLKRCVWCQNITRPRLRTADT